MSGIKLTSDTLDVTPSAGNIEYNGQFFGTDGNNSRAQMGRLVLETAKASTSGTSVDFTGVPSWVKKVTVMFNGVSTSGSSIPIVQIGDAGGIENTGYLGSAHSFTGGLFSSAFTTGFGLGGVNGAAFTRVGHLVITNISGNIWIASGVNSQTDQVESHVTAGSKTLSDSLTQLRITTVNGTDTFDAGSINILYEG